MKFRGPIGMSRAPIGMMALFAAMIASAENPSVPIGGSIQQALDSAPGTVVEIGPGDHSIDAPLTIRTDNSGLCGFGRIIQTNPAAPVLVIESACGVRISGLTLTRAAGREETTESAIRATNCQELDIENVRIIDNWSASPAISIEACRASRIRDCSVINYKRISIDDRTQSPLYGYAFRVIDGTGIGVQKCRGVQIDGNLVIEKRIYPTAETKAQYQLGQLTEGKNPTNKGTLAPKEDYANNWHQGSAILVTSPLETDHVLIANNTIQNAAQGIDIHADHVTCTNNNIDHAFIGIKCMHGSRNVIITENNVSHMDLWGLVMMPGTLSYPARAATQDAPAQEPNYTRGNIIANNIFSDFGFGFEYFNWQGAKSGVICLDSGQLPENPVMTDVIVQGNIVYDTGADQVLAEGIPKTEAPRYEYAVFIATTPKPQGLVFSNNIFHPGRAGISNLSLTP